MHEATFFQTEARGPFSHDEPLTDSIMRDNEGISAGGMGRSAIASPNTGASFSLSGFKCHSHPNSSPQMVCIYLPRCTDTHLQSLCRSLVICVDKSKEVDSFVMKEKLYLKARHRSLHPQTHAVLTDFYLFKLKFKEHSE